MAIENMLVAHDGSDGADAALASGLPMRAKHLLVMGTCEHSRFREDLVGGVTSTVLGNMPAPAQPAH